MLRIFTSVKIQRLRPGLNPRNWVPEASMLITRPPKPSDIWLSNRSVNWVGQKVISFQSRNGNCRWGRRKIVVVVVLL
jgi:hypothetical protein